ncbi:MAG: RluA family pseudouridine synthase [Clostridia bacterium]|nr:RluA family pseudouridine synthase [Clostridia bacterium]
MSNVYKITVDEASEGIRIDKLIVDKIPEITRNSVQKLLDSGNMTVNGIVRTKSYKTKLHDVIELTTEDAVESEAIAQDIPLDIRYEDDDLLVVNKPQGMVVHPAPGNPDGTLVNALLHHCSGSLSGINGVMRPGIVHRIDKFTSGLLIVAKNDLAHIGLAEQIKEHSFLREYRAVVKGHFKEKEGTVNKPIGRNPNDRKKMCVTLKNSREAVTHYEVLEEYDKYSYIKLRLETGRTHQIRVHMAYIGHPVAGDDVYGKPEKKLEGQCLHAGLIGFIHPRTQEYIEVTSELPEYFENFLGSCK